MRLLLAVLLLPGCALFSATVSEDEAWAVRTAMEQVEEGLQKQEAMTAEGAEALGKFALERSNAWADLGQRLLVMEASKDGELTLEEYDAAVKSASEQREKDAQVIMAHLAAMRQMKIWGDTQKAFEIMRTWTAVHLDAGEVRRKMVEQAYSLKDAFRKEE